MVEQISQQEQAMRAALGKAVEQKGGGVGITVEIGGNHQFHGKHSFHVRYILLSFYNKSVRLSRRNFRRRRGQRNKKSRQAAKNLLCATEKCKRVIDF
jgi:hypothetical protein